MCTRSLLRGLGEQANLTAPKVLIHGTLRRNTKDILEEGQDEYCGTKLRDTENESNVNIR